MMAGSSHIVELAPGTIVPLGVGRRIARLALVVDEEDLAGADEIAERRFENRAIRFAIDLPGGQSQVENADNWGIGPQGIDLDRLRALGMDGAGVRIGIADSVLDADHAVFRTLRAQGRLKAFSSFSFDGTKDVQRDPQGQPVPDAAAIPVAGHWHGTFCAAVLVGEPTDGKRHGIAEGAELVVTKVLQTYNNGSVASIYGGLEWLAEQRCDIVSLSLGWDGTHDEWAEPIATLLDAGVVVVAAAGNAFGVPGVQPSTSPANYPRFAGAAGLLISVGAVDATGAIWDPSGSEVIDWSMLSAQKRFAGAPPVAVPALVAPGAGVVSAAPANRYRLENGTSMATPHVAGVIALVLGQLRRTRADAAPAEAAKIVMDALLPPSPALAARMGGGRIDTAAIIAQLFP